MRHRSVHFPKIYWGITSCRSYNQIIRRTQAGDEKHTAMKTTTPINRLRNFARPLFLAISISWACTWFSACAGPAYRHEARVDNRVDRRHDRWDYREDRHVDRVDRRVDRRNDRWN